MLAQKRQSMIQKILQKDGAVTAARLVELLGVSVETVRRDLLNMERQGLLKRVHGGAVQVGGMYPYLVLEEDRNRTHSGEKRELALAAASFVEEGDCVGIASGSTTLEFARVLKERFTRLTVVTYSASICELLCDHADFTVILCGGHYRKEGRSFYGDLTMQMLERIHVKKGFIAPSAISLEGGIGDFDARSVPLQRKLLEHSDQVYILADSSKYERTALLKLADLSPEYHYITDSGLPEGMKKLYEQNGISIVAGETK